MKTKILLLVLFIGTSVLMADYYIDEELGTGQTDAKPELDIVGGIEVKNESKSVGAKFLNNRIRFFTNDGEEENYNNGIYSDAKYLAMHMYEKGEKDPFDFIITLDGVGIKTPEPKEGFDLTVEGKSYSGKLAINATKIPSELSLLVNGKTWIDTLETGDLQVDLIRGERFFCGEFSANEVADAVENYKPYWANYDSLAYKPDFLTKRTRVYDFFELGRTNYTTYGNGHVFCTDLNKYKFRIHKQAYMKKVFIGEEIKDYPTTNNMNIRLAVDGAMLAEEILVKKNENWPDYVFEDDYKLMPIDELENFVNKNGHLPEVPNATEVSKNGISVGKMQTTLLKKVEELTKYVIEINEKNEQLKNELKQLKNKLNN